MLELVRVKGNIHEIVKFLKRIVYCILIEFNHCRHSGPHLLLHEQHDTSGVEALVELALAEQQALTSDRQQWCSGATAGEPPSLGSIRYTKKMIHKETSAAK